MLWAAHGLIIEGLANDANILRAWTRSFASLPVAEGAPDLIFTLSLEDIVPDPPAGVPQFRQGDLLAYYVRGEQVTVHFPRYGQLQLDLKNGVTAGRVTAAVWQKYGVLEDILAIGLSPHLRRRGYFLLHAFAAVRDDRALLLVGGIGAGKTTTGMALLQDGWRLLSNDSPMVGEHGRIYHYPGVLAAYPATFARFAATRHLVTEDMPVDQKISVPAESIWPAVWQRVALVGAICFPQIEARAGHVLEPLPAPQALARLLPQAIEQWDRAMMPRHLSMMRALVEKAPAYLLRLGPDVATIPSYLRSLVS